MQTFDEHKNSSDTTCRLRHRLTTALLIIVAIAVGLSHNACEKEDWHRSLDGIAFSCEEMDFDTVFVSSGSTTHQFKIYNRGHDDLRIDQIGLLRRMQGGHSCFRVNIDGDTAAVVRDIEIASGDSCFVFVQATINPNGAGTHFIETDTLVLRSAGDERRLPLRACGRNAVYHLPDHTLQLGDGSHPTDNFGNRYCYSIIDCDNWRHDLPHVIVGYAVVDAQQTLQLSAGDELYFYNDAVLWVYDSATLHVAGSTAQPVLFTSVRHDGWYDSLPGQWGYIWLSSGSHDNRIDHAVIENGTVGILADTNVGHNPTLTVSHSIIRCHSMAGIIGQTAYIVGDDVLIHTCGTATLAMQYGGRYEWDRTTLANYWAYGGRNNPSVIINNHLTYNGVDYLYPLPLVRFTDCIVYGSRQSGELLTDLDDRVESRVEITHSIVRGGDWDVDPQFVDPWHGNYRLQQESPAEGLGFYSFDESAKKGAIAHAQRHPLIKRQRKIYLIR